MSRLEPLSHNCSCPSCFHNLGIALPAMLAKVPRMNGGSSEVLRLHNNFQCFTPLTALKQKHPKALSWMQLSDPSNMIIIQAEFSSKVWEIGIRTLHVTSSTRMASQLPWRCWHTRKHFWLRPLMSECHSIARLVLSATKALGVPSDSLMMMIGLLWLLLLLWWLGLFWLQYDYDDYDSDYCWWFLLLVTVLTSNDVSSCWLMIILFIEKWQVWLLNHGNSSCWLMMVLIIN